MLDFVISYMDSEEPWAEWMAKRLAEAGFSARLSAWDFGSKHPLLVVAEEAKRESACVLVMVSPGYMVALHGHFDWIQVFIGRSVE